jgi:hypothetical protein
MAGHAASIIIAVRCGHHEPTFIRVFAEPGDLPLDTYLRVCEAHDLSGDLRDVPEYVCSVGYSTVAA